MAERALPRRSERSAGRTFAAPRRSAEASPSMAQFLEIKAANPDCLLWYRMGDFYELFFDDAVAASAALGIVLTKRGKHQGQDIPMCGVPIHRADEYLQRLITGRPSRRRRRAARGSGGGEEARLEGRRAPRRRAPRHAGDADRGRAARRQGAQLPHGAVPSGARQAEPAKVPAEATLALASLDISTGEFEVGEVTGADLPGELARLSPSEVILRDALFGDAWLERWIELVGAAATPVPTAYFDSLAGEAALKQQLKVAELGGFGDFARAELAAVGALLKVRRADPDRAAGRYCGRRGDPVPTRSCSSMLQAARAWN